MTWGEGLYLGSCVTAALITFLDQVLFDLIDDW